MILFLINRYLRVILIIYTMCQNSPSFLNFLKENHCLYINRFVWKLRNRRTEKYFQIEENSKRKDTRSFY